MEIRGKTRQNDDGCVLEGRTLSRVKGRRTWRSAKSPRLVVLSLVEPTAKPLITLITLITAGWSFSSQINARAHHRRLVTHSAHRLPIEKRTKLYGHILALRILHKKVR